MKGNLDDFGKLVLRLTLGILILFHGTSKLMHGIGSIEGMVTATGMPGFVAYGVYAGEVLGPLLLIAGFHARIGAALVAGNRLSIVSTFLRRLISRPA